MDPINLNLGCGEKPIPGFINVDIREMPGVDIVTDIEKLDLPDNYADLIYSCHTLEHIDRHRTEDVLKEWFRVLKPGGTIRLAVPDFAAVVARYMATGAKALYECTGLVCGGHKNPYDAHKNLFDFEKLKFHLWNAGFNNVRLYEWRDTFHANFDDYSKAYIPHMDFNKGQLMSLNVEATKPC